MQVRSVVNLVVEYRAYKIREWTKIQTPLLGGDGRFVICIYARLCMTVLPVECSERHSIFSQRDAF